MGKEEPSIPSRKEVWKMFDAISPTYDKLNTLLSCGMDRIWRKKMALYVPKSPSIRLLDCATGTADQLLILMDLLPHITQAVGVDLAQEMLVLGEEKLKQKSYREKVSLEKGDICSLSYPSNFFDCITLSFGIRNAFDVSLCLREMYRLLKPKGRFLILEFSIPENALLRAFYLFYLRKVLPKLGAWISKNKEAYTYLNKTIETFPSGSKMCALLKASGFSHCSFHPLTGGITTIYQGEKRE